MDGRESLRAVSAAAFCAFVSFLPARADVDAEVSSGDKVTGTIFPATEVERFRFRVPKGAAVAVKAKSARKGPDLSVLVSDEGGSAQFPGEGRSVSLKFTAGSSGLFTAESSNGFPWSLSRMVR